MSTLITAFNDPKLFEPFYCSPSWDRWRTVLRAAEGAPLCPADKRFFAQIAGGREPPTRPVREQWIIAGRRAGKDSIAALIAAHAAGFFRDGARLRPGERAHVLCLARDRDQARTVLGYIKAFFTRIPLLRGMVRTETKSGLVLSNNVEITVITNDFRSIRGRTILCAILDECAFWKDDASAAPDVETYRAILPSLATLPTAKLIGISSPYAKCGLLYERFNKYFGQNDPDVLVVRAPSTMMNPTLDHKIVEAAIASDPEAAKAEWLGEFRDDDAAYVSADVVQALVAPGRHEIPRINSNIKYHAFVDPAGGSGSDSMTMAIAHAEEGRVIVDAIRERRPKFSPESVVAEYADLMKAYGISQCRGDRYAGSWPAERITQHGIQYYPAAKAKSDLYLNFLPLLNSGRIELLDNPRCISQLCSLERTTGRGSGRDIIDHPRGAHDDIINAVTGAAMMAMEAVSQPMSFGMPVIVSKADAGIDSTPPPGSERQYGDVVIGYLPTAALAGAPTATQNVNVNDTRPPNHYLRGPLEPWRGFVDSYGEIRTYRLF